MTAMEGFMALAFATANTGLLTGIFFRLGGLSRAHDDFCRRLQHLEGKGA